MRKFAQGHLLVQRTRDGVGCARFPEVERGKWAAAVYVMLRVLHVSESVRISEEVFQTLDWTGMRAWLQWSDASETEVQAILVPSYCPWVDEI